MTQRRHRMFRQNESEDHHMTYQTNNGSWVSGYNGNQVPYGATPQQAADHQRGVQQKQAEAQKAYEAAWKKT
jgi:hypothetical protein